MAKRRLLPKYVSAFIDVRGKERLRFRRTGYPAYYFKAKLGTEEFRSEYRACLDGKPLEIKSPRHVTPGSIDDLITRYLSVPLRLGPTSVTQAKVRAIIESFRQEHGHRMVADVEFDHLDAIITRKAEKRIKGNRTIGGVHAARKLRKELRRLFDFAVKIRMRPDNPVEYTERVRNSPGAPTGFHSWTEEEIAQFRSYHPLGTRPRLAMELMLWTGQRRGDAINMGPDDIKDGHLIINQEKTGKTLALPIAPQLMKAIRAMPPMPEGSKTFLLTSRGKPFHSASFGNWFRKQCNEASLPHCTAHGLRKAIMRRMAELNMSNQTLKSVSGHSGDDEVALYTKAANQTTMANAAISQLSDWEMSNIQKK